MKLLFDQNLSASLVSDLRDLFPDSQHVFMLGLHESSDETLWHYARQHGFLVVSKDSDFSDLSTSLGYPPKLLWLQLGNCSTGAVEALIRSKYLLIRSMHDDPERGILVLLR